MKWQPVARRILSSYQTHPEFTCRELESTLDLIEEGNPEAAFLQANNFLLKRKRIFGWNKTWDGNNLLGWYGPIVTVEPLRMTALEIERGENQLAEIKLELEKISDSTKANKNISPVFRILSELGLFSVTAESSKMSMQLLRRINLDRREQPLIDRWKWTSNCGLAWLTDEGRIQISKELVWARSIESALNKDGILCSRMSAFLSKVHPDKKEVILDKMKICDNMCNCLKSLELFGFAKIQIDRISFKTFPGMFPQIAVRLFQ